MNMKSLSIILLFLGITLIRGANMPTRNATSPIRNESQILNNDNVSINETNISTSKVSIWRSKKICEDVYIYNGSCY